MREEAVVVIRTDIGDTPAKAAQVEQAYRNIAQAGQVSARQTADAMRQLPAKFSEIAAQLATGGNPLRILVRQSGQLQESFGGVGAAIKGIGAALNPVLLGVGAAAAAIGGLGYAAMQGARETARLRDIMALTGNASGLTAGRLDEMADRITAASGQTVGAVREITLALAATGQVGGGAIETTAAAVARLADVTGRSATDIARDFAGMSSGVAKWAAEHNKAWNFITFEQYKYIERLEEQNQAELAAQVVGQALIDHLKDQATQLGFVETAWQGIAKAASGAWNAMMGLGRAPTTEGGVDALSNRIRQLRQMQDAPGISDSDRAAYEADLQVLLQRQEELQEVVRLERRSASITSAQAAETRQRIADDRKRSGRAGAAPGVAQDWRTAWGQEMALRTAEWTNENAKLLAGWADEDRKREEAEAQAAERRRRTQDDFLQQLLDANRRAGAELITDETERGRALVELDRQIALRRLAAMGFTPEGQSQAEQLINSNAARAVEALGQQAGANIYQETRNALMMAFQASSNPAKAFAQALGNAIFTRVTASLADAAATALVGRNGSGGLLGQFMGLVGGVVGGGMSVGGGYTPPIDGALPGGGMATGTNYVPRDMVALVHRGEAIVPRQYNPAAGGSGGGNSTVINLSISGPVPAEQVALVEAAVGRAMARAQRRAMVRSN